MAASAASSSATAAASSDASGAASPTAAPRIYMALPKGHMKDGVFDLLSGAGVKVRWQASPHLGDVSTHGNLTTVVPPLAGLPE